MSDISAKIVEIGEIDVPLYKDKAQTKSFVFRNRDDTFYDFTGSVVTMEYFKDGIDNPPEEVVGTVTIATGRVAFAFTAILLDTIGKFPYIIISDKSGVEDVILKGELIVKDYVPFTDTIESYLAIELPVGLILDTNFVTQKIKYWQLYLQSAYSISDSLVHNENSWPLMVNILIAKLVAYDALVLSIRGNVLNVFGSSVSTSSTTKSVKSIETGPAKVEFYPTGDTLSQIIKSTSTAGGNNILTNLAEDLCGLASKLTLKLPMCKAENLVMIFQFYQNTSASSPMINLQGDPVVSIG